MKQILLSALGVAALTAALWADPPARVGRLSLIDGAVSFSQAAGEAWQTATLNYPVTTGNQLSTAAGGKAEVQIGSAAVRLASDTGVTVEALDDQSVQIRLDKGVISVSLRKMGRDQTFQVDTQTAGISLAGPGRYRIDQVQSGEAKVITRSGDAAVTGGQASFHVYSGQSADIPASGPEENRIASVPAPDSWDSWVASRDSRMSGLASTRYVSSEMDGVQDLDEYGNWSVAAGYGPIWIPQAVPVGWAPYAFGHWVWIEPWGWTWVDDEPWGFAPFHYGRWVLYTGVWCWVPGPIVVRPVYAPALVRWVGPTPLRGTPPGQGHVTWVPLQPRQVFRPPYQASISYQRAVNGTVAYPPRVATGPRPVPWYPNGRPGYMNGTLPRPLPPDAGHRSGYMTRAPAPVQPSQPWQTGRPFYEPPRGQRWVEQPRQPAYVGPEGDHARQWPPSFSGDQEPWLLKRSGR